MRARHLHIGSLIAGNLGIILGGVGLWTRVEGYGLSAVVLFVTGLWLVALALFPFGHSRRKGEPSEKKFHSLLEATPEAIVITRNDGLIFLVNKRTEKLFQYSRKELIGMPIEFLLRQSMGNAPACLNSSDFSMFNTPQAKKGSCESYGQRRNGTEVPVEITFSPLEAPEGQLIINLIRDVSDRKTRERRRAARHAASRILAEADTLSQVAPALLAPISQALGWDAAALWVKEQRTGEPDLLGCWSNPGQREEPKPGSQDPVLPVIRLYEQALTVAEPVWIPDLGKEGVTLEVAAGIRGRVRCAACIPILLGNKVFGAMEFYGGEPREQDDNQLETLGIIGGQVAHFIQRKRGEEAVHDSEVRKTAILEAALDAIITIDHQGKVIEFNPAAEAIFGRPRSEAMGFDLAELVIPPDLRERFHRGLKRFGASGQGPLLGQRLEMTALRKGGEEFPAELTITRIRVGGPPMFTGFLRDITERRRTEEALRRTEEQFRQSQKMEAVGRLAGGIAHDFNNLLTVIIGCGEFLLRNLADGDPTRDHALNITQAGERAACLTRQLLAFSRKQVFTPKVLDLNAVVTNLDMMLKRLLGEDVQLAAVLAPSLGFVKTDPGQIEQVIMNLVVNARDAMPQGGQLTIETANINLDEDDTQAWPEVRPGPYVMLAVSDTGCGMDKATLARLFEPFFTTKELGKGTGLGLATVYGIIKQSGGHIAVHSEPGSGSTFRVYLPSAQEALTAPPGVMPARAVPGGTETVLLVEDEDQVRTLAKLILQSRGYKVVEARSGEEVLNFSEEQIAPVQLVVTDVIMPDMNGLDLARRLLERRPNLKVLFMSGYTDGAILHQNILDDSAAFLQKPFTPDTLANKLREVLSA